MNPRIVISGVNLTEMGPLAVFKDALKSLALYASGSYQLVALVHNRALFEIIPGVEFIEFPDVKSSWLRRVWFEFWQCRAISSQMAPALWLAMDNVTPLVAARAQVVYCHNPSPFYRFRFKDLWLDWKFGLFTLFFRHLYGINIRRNDYVVVQQHWIRQSFQRMYGVKKVIVAHPNLEVGDVPSEPSRRDAGVYRFFYPAFPRTFKNAEVALSAVEMLEKSGFHNFELWLTFDGSATRYARSVVKRFSHLRSVRWLGLLQREEVLKRYAEADCLVFPSKLETWGMPITEFRITTKPMIVADLPYAHETVGNYDRVAFFDPNDSVELAKLMKGAACGAPIFSAVTAGDIPAPFARNWRELWQMLLPPAGPFQGDSLRTDS